MAFFIIVREVRIFLYTFVVSFKAGKLKGLND